MTSSTETSALAAGERAGWALVFGAWLIAAAGTLGALFFSLVMKLPPCDLCWYQRIFMFPLTLILPFGMFPFDRGVIRYASPLAAGGWLIAAFQQALVAGWIPERIKPCSQGVPCSETVATWFGFVTIPLLSLVAFTLIGALLIAAHLRSSRP